MRTIITGAASGIGRAVADRIARSRVAGGRPTLLLVDRDEAALHRAAATLGGHAAICVADLSTPDCGDRVVDAALDALGGVEALVSNAGVIQAASLADLDVADFDRAFAVNTRATWLMAKAALPHLRDKGGAIVATASLSAGHVTPALGAYAASKAALVMIVRQLANEWGQYGIRCNTVSPGPTLTPMTEAGYADDARRRSREAAIPLRRLNAPDDIADAIVFLLSDAARGITGVDLLVDGGLGTTLMTASGAGSGQGTGAGVGAGA